MRAAANGAGSRLRMTIQWVAFSSDDRDITPPPSNVLVSEVRAVRLRSQGSLSAASWATAGALAGMMSTTTALTSLLTPDATPEEDRSLVA